MPGARVTASPGMPRERVTASPPVACQQGFQCPPLGGGNKVKGNEYTGGRDPGAKTYKLLLVVVLPLFLLA